MENPFSTLPLRFHLKSSRDVDNPLQDQIFSPNSFVQEKFVEEELSSEDRKRKSSCTYLTEEQRKSPRLDILAVACEAAGIESSDNEMAALENPMMDQGNSFSGMHVIRQQCSPIMRGGVGQHHGYNVCDSSSSQLDGSSPGQSRSNIPKKERRKRCGTCAPCQVTSDCGQCQFCQNKKTLKQACALRQCLFLKSNKGRRSVPMSHSPQIDSSMGHSSVTSSPNVLFDSSNSSISAGSFPSCPLSSDNSNDGGKTSNNLSAIPSPQHILNQLNPSMRDMSQNLSLQTSPTVQSQTGFSPIPQSSFSIPRQPALPSIHGSFMPHIVSAAASGNQGGLPNWSWNPSSGAGSMMFARMGQPRMGGNPNEHFGTPQYISLPQGLSVPSNYMIPRPSNNIPTSMWHTAPQACIPQGQFQAFHEQKLNGPTQLP